jgi:hypothetical protein
MVARIGGATDSSLLGPHYELLAQEHEELTVGELSTAVDWFTAQAAEGV